jgi:N-acyl-D-amino-acid deacylase
MRNEGTELETAVREAIAIGEAASCPVEISHLKVDSPRRWGVSEKALAMIDEARKRGVDVRADQYAYTAASSNLGIRLPSWVLEGGQDAINRRLDDPATWERIKQETIALFTERGFTDLSFAVVASYGADPAYNGRSLKQIAEAVKGSGSVDSQLEVVRMMMRAGGASMVYHLMSEDDITRIMRHPQVAVASDSWVLVPGRGVPHPRGYGNNPRVLGRYVRELGAIALEEAVRKMTSLPAGHFGFADRGRIAEGYAADLVVFDRATIGDPSTYDRPHQYAAGIDYVLVNGVTVVKDGQYTGARPGQILKRQRVEAVQ